MSTSVEAFAPTPGYEALQYPYKRPEGSFYTDGTEVRELPDDFGAFYDQANELLGQAGLPLLEDRIPVISYGSNSNPYRLREKMQAFGNEDSPIAAELQTVPHITATLPDTIVAWHGKPGQKGSTFAELYQDDDTIGESSRVHISYLSPVQVAMLHAIEGVTYHFVRLEARVGSDERPMPAFAYVAGKSEILVKDGKVVQVKRTEDPEGSKDAMTAEQAIDFMLSHAGETVESTTARQLVAEMRVEVPLTERKAQQAAIRARLGAAGVNRAFSFPGALDLYLRGDFTFTGEHAHDSPQPVQLLEQVLEPLRPIDPSQRNQKGDIAVRMRRRAHQELLHE